MDASSAKISPPFPRFKKCEKCRLFVRSYEVQDQRESGNGKFDGSRWPTLHGRGTIVLVEIVVEGLAFLRGRSCHAFGGVWLSLRHVRLEQ